MYAVETQYLLTPKDKMVAEPRDIARQTELLCLHHIQFVKRKADVLFALGRPKFSSLKPWGLVKQLISISRNEVAYVQYSAVLIALPQIAREEVN